MDANTSRRKVLVVDDHADIRLMCRVNLALEGYDVIEAPDGVTGLARARDDAPDVILLDVMMPGLDGWSMLDELKANPDTKAIPVILLTARVHREDQVRGWRAGAADYLSKPFNPSALSEIVHRTILSGDDEADRRKRALAKLSIQ